MGSLERSRKRVLVWKKAMVHFSLCFVMGFFTGFAPITGKDSFFKTEMTSSSTPQTNTTKVFFPQQAPETLDQESSWSSSSSSSLPPSPPQQAHDRSLISRPLQPVPSNQSREEEPEIGITPRRLIIIVTPTSAENPYKIPFLRRMSDTLRLVPPPLLWIVVEKQPTRDEVSQMLRKTGVMYRHVVYKENFTSPEEEFNHQRNVALRHIEHHKLSGIVHFAGLDNVYDLGFFDEIRDIEVFGAWPMAMLKANRQKVIIEGPVCDSSQVLGWHLRNINNETTSEAVPPPIHVSSFAFNSSILWDPERWGRPSSDQGTKQDSVKYVKEVVLEDDAKVKGIPPQDCSRVMLWHLDFPKTTPIIRS